MPRSFRGGERILAPDTSRESMAPGVTSPEGGARGIDSLTLGKRGVLSDETLFVRVQLLFQHSLHATLFNFNG